METRIIVGGDKSNVTLTQVASADVRTTSGNVQVNGATGLIEISTVSGAIVVHNSRDAVRAVSIAGAIEIKCAQGRIEVTNTQGPIELISIDGDTDARSTNSSVRLSGPMREDGRYHMTSMTGRVEMLLPANTKGVTAMLSSYRGLVETDFPLNPVEAARDKTTLRRLTGRIGNGRAQIILDSFEGLVRLTKVAAGSIESCKR
jgi:hypothetical protein